MARMTVAELAERVEALTNVVSTLVEAQQPEAPAKSRRSRSKSTDLVSAGTSFDYTNGNGVTTRHKVEKVQGRGDSRRAYTDQGQRFKLTTLSKLNGSAVSILS